MGTEEKQGMEVNKNLRMMASLVKKFALGQQDVLAAKGVFLGAWPFEYNVRSIW